MEYYVAQQSSSRINTKKYVFQNKTFERPRENLEHIKGKS